MKILLIDPMKPGGGGTRASRVSVPDVALGGLAACLEADGHDVAVIDAPAEAATFDDVEKKISELKPGLVGMPLFTYKAAAAAEIARRIRRCRPEAKIVVGGAHATALPRRTLLECPEFDFAVVREGEETLRELVAALASGAPDFSGIAGLVWRGEREIIRNGNREWIKDLDALPYPDWSLFPLEKYRPMYANGKFLELPVSSSRGCAGRCSFCFRLSGPAARRRSAANVLGELLLDMEKYGAKSVMFVDEAFTSDAARTRELCGMMIGNGIPGRLRWICQTRIDMVEPELLRLMRAAGCTHVSCGIESGSQEILDRNGKGINLESAREAVKWAKEAGLGVDTNYILGLPFETPETLKETRKFPLTTRADFASFFIFVPYPGTVARRLAGLENEDAAQTSEDWSAYEIQTGGVAGTKGLPAGLLERFQLLCYLSFYLRPSKWGKLLTMAGIRTLPSIVLRALRGKW